MMITTLFQDLPDRHRMCQSGFARSPFDIAMQVRGCRSRRSVSSVPSFDGGERLDLSQIERRSFFDLAAPERC